MLEDVHQSNSRDLSSTACGASASDHVDASYHTVCPAVLWMPVPTPRDTQPDRLTRLPRYLQELITADLPDISLPDRETVESITLVALDDTRFAANAVRAVVSQLLPVPLLITDDYDPRPYIGDSSLVIVFASDPDREETVEAASAAAVEGARVCTVSPPGRLTELGRAWKAGLVELDAGEAPLEPTMLLEFVVPALKILERLRFLPLASLWLEEAVDQLEARSARIQQHLATGSQLDRIHPVPLKMLYGSGQIGGAAASHWKGVINRYTKAPAYSQEVPGLFADELKGWGQHGDVTRQICGVVCLRHDFEHPAAARRFDALSELMLEVVGAVVTVRAAGDNPLAQLFDLQFLGSSFAVAGARNVGLDPWTWAEFDELA